MGLHRITHLKAPWPAGAQVGDVIELGDTVPAWAAGKCEPAAEGAEATVTFEQPEQPSEPAAEGAEPAPARKGRKAA